MATSEISPIEFGRVLGHLEGIRSELADLKSRVVMRLDQLEGRVMGLEKSEAGKHLYTKIIDKAIWSSLGGATIWAVKVIGMH